MDNISNYFNYHINVKSNKIETDMIPTLNNRAEYICEFLDIKNPQVIDVHLTGKDFDEYNNETSVGLYFASDKYIDKYIPFISRDYFNKMFKKKYGKQYEWLRLGLMYILSGYYDNLSDITQFKYWYYDDIIRRDRIVPEVHELNNYDNRSFCYILVRYLMTKYDIRNMLLDNRINEINLEEELSNCIEYYNNSFKVDETKDDYKDIKNPEELMDYMNKNIIYGCTYKDHSVITYSLGDRFEEEYITSSPETTITNKVGNCIDQTALEHHFFDSLNIENHIYCLRRETEETMSHGEIGMHCLLIYKLDEKYYYFEHSNSNRRGIHEFDTLDAALESVHEGDHREATEIPDIPSGLSFREFNRYVNKYMNTSELKRG